ncbi:MAG: sensor histidine kinase [Leptospirales bacterium]|nr:sensor histidine kinase [Leptospirales bacterium]
MPRCRSASLPGGPLTWLLALAALCAAPVGLSAACPEAQLSDGQSALSLAGAWRLQSAPGAQEIPADWTRVEFDDSAWRLAAAPADFRALKLKPPAQGLSVFLRCRIQLAGPPPAGAALFLDSIEEADAVFFNGVQVGETGSLAGRRVDIERRRLYALPATLWQEGPNVIAIRVFATTGDGGLRFEPRLVDQLSQAKTLALRDLPTIVFSWSYVLVAAFFGLFYLFFWRQQANLYFALFSLSLGMYNLIRTQIRYEWFDSFVASYKTELALLFSLPVFFLEYLHHATNARRKLPVLALYGAYALLLTGDLLFGASARAWKLLININLVLIVAALALTAWTFLRNYAAHRDRLRFLLVGFVVLLPVVVWDILSTLNIHPYPRLLVYGFAAFLLFASLQLSDTILQLYGNIKEQEQELRLLEKRKTRSIFNISSEFTAILSGLREGLGAEESSRKRGNRSGAHDRLRSSALNLDNLVQDSRLLHLLESGEYHPRLGRFSLNKLVAEQIARALLATEQPQSRIRSKLPDEENEAESDAELLAAALYHLVENALLYSTGKVEVGAERIGGQLLLQVRDEGPGMNAHQQQAVFQKFVRNTPDDDSAPPGSGVGLTIVREIADVLEGEIKLEGGGYFSTLTLRVPEKQAR